MKPNKVIVIHSEFHTAFYKSGPYGKRKEKPLFVILGAAREVVELLKKLNHPVVEEKGEEIVAENNRNPTG